MSDFKIEIVKVGPIGKHPNADSLSMTKVYDYPVIFKTAELLEGDLAVYIPVDALLPDCREFAFVWGDKPDPSYSKRTVKAKKLRGVLSMGLLLKLDKALANVTVPMCDTAYKVGDDIAAVLGITKAEEDAFEKPKLTGDNAPRPEWLHRYTDIESLRKHKNVFMPNENVVITEKVHGSNAIFGWHSGEFYMSSKNFVKTGSNHIWYQVSEKMNLAKVLEPFPDLMFCGEIYGKVQSGFPYDKFGSLGFMVFDIYKAPEGSYLPHLDVVATCKAAGLTMVPVLYLGPWLGLEEHLGLSDGPTQVPGATHCREGFVVKSIIERVDTVLGRCILKVAGETYLLKK